MKKILAVVIMLLSVCYAETFIGDIVMTTGEEISGYSLYFYKDGKDFYRSRIKRIMPCMGGYSVILAKEESFDNKMQLVDYEILLNEGDYFYCGKQKATVIKLAPNLIKVRLTLE